MMAVKQRFGSYLLDRSRPKPGHVPELAGLCLRHCLRLEGKQGYKRDARANARSV
jgi:hypothetical protein